MSDIRFNQWLHQSGTGGVSQVDGGHVGIGTTNPDIAVHTANTKKINVGIVTANSVFAGNFYGDGSNLTGISAGVSVANQADDRLITATGTSNALNAESSLIYNSGGLVINSGDLYLNDSIIHGGNTPTKIRFPSVNTISMETNGAERLRITSAGHLTLQGGKIYGEDNASNSLHLQSTSGNNNHSRVEIGTVSGSDNGGIHFYTAGSSVATQRMVIKGTTGRVGIATDEPFSNLTVYGENRSGGGSVTGQITAKDNAAWNASPTGGLIFQGHFHSNGANAIFGGITGFKENGTEGNYAGALAFHTRPDGAVSQERLRITSGGRIELKTDGGGIKFPDTQTPTNSYTPGSTSGGGRVGISSEMRYYETGTFIPNVSSTVLNSLQNPAFTDNSYARRIGRYVRVGHLVFVNIEIKMAGTVTYANGGTSTAPVCITASTPFKYGYSGRYDVTGQPDKNPASIWYNGSGLTNDTLYANVSRNFPGDTMIQITKPGSGGVDQYNATNFGEIFPANSHIAVSFTYAIDLDNADY